MRDKQTYHSLWDNFLFSKRNSLTVLQSYFILLITVCITVSCTSKEKQAGSKNTTDSVNIRSGNKNGDLTAEESGVLFSKLSPEETGIEFANQIEEPPEFNNLTYPFMLNGGGVAIGDINNDGLSDIFWGWQ